MTLIEAAPPSGMTEIRSWTVGSVDDVALVRAELEFALEEARRVEQRSADTEVGAVADRIVLVASELATNGVRHGGPPVLVRLLRGGGVTAVDVVDHNPDDPPVLVTDRARGGGFGLVLARRACRALGWFRADADTKHVWAQFAV